MSTGGRISVFGHFEVQVPDGQSASFRTRKAAEVVAPLALHSPRRISRPVLASEIWPDAPETSRLNNLRPALVYVKSALASPTALRIEGDQLQLDESLESDGKEALRLERRSRSGESD